MKYILKRLLIAVVLLVLMLMVYPVEFPSPVNAAGWSTVNVTQTIVNTKPSFFAATVKTFVGYGQASSCDSIVGGNGRVGWHGGTPPDRAYPDSTILAFNIGGLPVASNDIESAYLVFSVSAKDDTSTTYSDFYFSAWKTDLDIDMTLTIDDNSNWVNSAYGRISPPTHYTSLTAGSWYMLPLVDTDLLMNDYGSTNMTYIQLMTENQGQSVSPVLEPAQHIYFDFAVTTCYLQITYAAPAAARTTNILVNAADYVGVLTGSENITGVSWLSPRAAYSDEQLGFRVEGDAGCAFTYEVIDSLGAVLESGNTTIKVNGYYYEYYVPDMTYTGWIRLRVRQTTNSKYYYSSYGRVEPAPSATQNLLTVSAESTEYPPYDNDFSEYVIYKNDVGILHWKTNLIAGDMANYSLVLMAGGNNLTDFTWNGSFSYLISSYFLNVDSANNGMAGWRYMMFSPEVSTPGYNTYDGFIQDMGKAYAAVNCGFWQGAVKQNSDNDTITWTESAHFYLNDIAQGVSITVKDNDTTDGLLDAVIVVGNNSKVASRLSYLDITVLDSMGVIVSVDDGFVLEGNNIISFACPASAGDYQARFRFYDTLLVPDYEYIRDMPFSIAIGGDGSPTVAPDTNATLKERLNALMARYGLDNMAGHWMVILGLCVLFGAVFGLYGKMPLVATVLCILTFGLGLYIGWVDQWVIILIALGAGFAVYRLFKKKAVDAEE